MSRHCWVGVGRKNPPPHGLNSARWWRCTSCRVRHWSGEKPSSDHLVPVPYEAIELKETDLTIIGLSCNEIQVLQIHQS